MKACLKGVTMASLITMGTSALFTSCSKENELTDEISSEDLTEIKLTSTIVNGTVSGWTRTRGDEASSTPSSTAVASGDTLRLCVSDSEENTYTRLYLQQVTAGDDGVMTGTTKMYFPTSGHAVDLYAYRGNYTIISNSGKEIINDGTVFDVYVNADQSGDDNYKRSDFIFGKVSGQTRTQNSVEITLGHLLSRITVTVTGNDDIVNQNMALKAIKLNGVEVSGTYTLPSTWESRSTPGDSIKDVTIWANTETGGTAISKDTPITDQAVIVPQSVAGKTLEFVTTGTNGKSFTYKFPEGTTFTAGKSYNYTVKLTPIEIHVVAKITDWVDEDSTITAEYDVPSTNSLNQI